jgi:opacity protein-like surface antigen
MKKLVFLVCVMFAFVDASYAQFYLRAGLGYAIPQATQTIDGSSIPYSGSLNLNNTNGSQTFSIKGASYSAGLQSAIGVGYLITDHIGIQLDAGIGLASHKYTFAENNVDLGGGVLGTVSYTQQAKTPVIMMPSVVLQTGGDKWNIYSRFGLALPLNTSISQDQVLSNAPGTGALTVDDLNFHIKNSFSLGFAAAAGVQYKFNDKFSIWGEISLLSLSAFIKQSDLTTWTENGQSVALSNYAPYPTTVKYSKNVTVDTSIANASQPTYSQPFSNMGINVGITIRLSEKRASARHNDEYIDDDKNFKRKRF